MTHRPSPGTRHTDQPAVSALARAWHDLAPLLALFWHERRRMLLAGAALAAVTAVFGMALLGLSGWFLSATAVAGFSAATALAFDVFMPSSGIRLFTLGRTAARYGERLATHEATLSVIAALRVRLFHAWAQPRAARQLALRPARLLFRLTADIDALDALYLRIAVPLVAALAAALVAGLALGLVHALLGLAVLALLLAGSAGVLHRAWQRALRPSRLRAHAVEAIRARSADLVAGQTDLLMAGRLRAQCEAIQRADTCLARCDDALSRIDARAALSFGVLGSTVLAVTLLGAGWLVASGVVGVPVAVLALLLALTATEPFAALRRGALELGRIVLAARRVSPQLRARTTGRGASDPVPGRPADPPAQQARPSPERGGAMVLAEHLFVSHADAACPSLHDISLHIAPGERVALVGASGAGKSTLLAALTGELQARSGTVHAAPCGWLTQRTELFQDSVRDNLLLARPGAADDDLWQALATAGLAATVRSWPRGLDTPLGEGGQGLSGGQARRLALARLLLRPAPLWLLDEATEGLDDATAADVLARLSRAADGRTVLMATHSQREAALADRLVVLAHGRIAVDARRGENAYALAFKALRPDVRQGRLAESGEQSSA